MPIKKSSASKKEKNTKRIAVGQDRSKKAKRGKKADPDMGLLKSGADDELEEPREVDESLFEGIKTTIIRGRSSNIEKPLLSGDRIIIYDVELSNQLYARSFGEIKKGQLFLSMYEACLLVEVGKIEVFDKDGKKLRLSSLIRYGEKLNENFGMKYDVYRDLRAVRGYVVKSGLKFGTDFVVYARGKKPGVDHSKWMVHVIPETQRLDFTEVTRVARLATSVKKKMLFSIVTERGPVYYEVGRKKM